ncbi:RNA replication [Gossypium australe]|uniref:RNA replication n=1 Tax=Gossypium australe TaxID=47621 RepID=A0A5B6WXB3_9ROSI|nr:RNA replication [Gossypium australe]
MNFISFSELRDEIVIYEKYRGKMIRKDQIWNLIEENKNTRKLANVGDRSEIDRSIITLCTRVDIRACVLTVCDTRLGTWACVTSSNQARVESDEVESTAQASVQRTVSSEEFRATADDDLERADFWLENIIRVLDELSCTPVKCLKCVVSLLKDTTYH